MIAASDLPVVLTAAGGLVVAVSGVASAWAAKRSARVATDVAVIEAAQSTAKDAIDFLRSELRGVRAELVQIEGRLEECEAARRKLIAELSTLKGRP